MTMKLLPKSKIQEAKAAAKKQEIDQGVQIARRVDRVREVLSTEEASLEKFRRETIAKIHEETRIAGEERDVAIKERDTARRDRDIALQPLTKEWEELAEAKKQVEEDTNIANALLQVARGTDREARELMSEASDTLLRAETKEDAAREALIEADKAREEAKTALTIASEVKANAMLLAEKMDQELLHRDEAMAMKEKGVILREEHLIAGEAELAKGWKLLEDRKATFEREIKRQRNK